MDKTTKDAFREIDKAVVKGIFADKDLNRLLQPFFVGEKERKEFVRKCLARPKTRRMLLTVQEYVGIADGMGKIKPNRPALNLIFLMAFAESLAKQRTRRKDNDSLDIIKEFFRFIPKEESEILQRRFRRALLTPKTSSLRFSSIIRILYDVRNRAVHGEDYWSFNLLTKEEKGKLKQEKYTSYAMATSGKLGKTGKKKDIFLETSLTYEELRDIFIKTAIANISTLLR